MKQIIQRNGKCVQVKRDPKIARVLRYEEIHISNVDLLCYF